MDSEAIRKKRQDDIEAKRKRLEEMRKNRESAGAPAAPPPPKPAPAPEPVAVKTEAEVKLETEALVSSLLAEPVQAEQAAALPAPLVQQQSLQEKLSKLSTVKSFNVIDILPMKAEMYDKGTQMEEEDILFLKGTGADLDEEALPETGSDNGTPEPEKPSPNPTPIKSFGSPTPKKALFSGSKASEANEPLTAALEVDFAFAESARTKLSEQERAKITTGATFQNFLRTASLYVERALELTEEHDIIRDFSVDEKGLAGDLTEHAAFVMPPAGSASTSAASVFEEEHVLRRPVMDLQWSHLVPELFLAAYGAKAAAPSSSGAGKTTAAASARGSNPEDDSPGLVCVWSRDLHSRPEYRFSASSPVLAAVFHSHEQHLVLGGCYSGQILLWDMKTNKALPVQRSSMSGKGHKHPVYAMAMTASAVTAELVSVSTDGLLCHWDGNRLTEPVSAVQLHLPAPTANPSAALSSLAGFLSPVRDASAAGNAVGQSPLNISAMAFTHSAGDHSSGTVADVGAADLIFGCGSGELVRTPLPYRDNHPAAAKVDAHYGFITSIEPHPSHSNKFKHLLLSSSLDWTVKLWDLKDFTQPIFEFFTPSYDYVCDVQWSPIHPAVFVTVTSGGRLSLWNLAKSTAEPVDALEIGGAGAVVGDVTAGLAGVSLSKGAEGAGAGGGASGGARALNKVVWARDGLSVLCGDSQGTLHMLRLHPTAVQPSPQDESRFESAIVNRAAEAHVVEESKMTGPDVTPPRPGEPGSKGLELGGDGEAVPKFALE